MAVRWILLGLRWLRRLIRYTLLALLFCLLIQRSNFPVNSRWGAITAVIRGYQFDYVDWEVGALLSKIGQTLWGAHPFMNERDRSQYVRDYMADLELARQLEAQIDAMFADPNVADPRTASFDLRQQRDSLRADLRSRQTLVESILEGQVAAVLVDEGFGLFGQLLPPISMRFTRVPNLLVISPRERIYVDVTIALDPLPIDEIVAIEERLYAELNVSSLIVPLGGIALYPAMILETTSIPWAVETFAHEWLHHYFFFFPLGLNYFSDTAAGESRIINETAADLFGEEIARIVLERYYPELAPAAEQNEPQLVTYQPFAQEVRFDYGAEMNETRVNVDRIMVVISELETKAERLYHFGMGQSAQRFEALAQSVVAKSETYMEQRRAIFFENGYRIRKLNQAYFAFYGGYQGGIPGIGGEDPIGPAVREIRAMSESIHAWIVTLRGITTRDELVSVRDRMRARQNRSG